MKRPSKKDIQAAVSKLKDKSSGPAGKIELNAGKTDSAKSSVRIRKQGV